MTSPYYYAANTYGPQDKSGELYLDKLHAVLEWKDIAFYKWTETEFVSYRIGYVLCIKNTIKPEFALIRLIMEIDGKLGFFVTFLKQNLLKSI